jgi:acyl-CoA reductase-like NAD-dependent aldehyde dehydrogenase
VIPTDLFPSQAHPLFIDGRDVACVSGRTFDTWNPATGQLLGSVQEANAEDVDRAVQAADRAYRSVWCDTSVKERARLLRRLAGAFEKRIERFTWLETLNVGRPISITRASMRMMPDALDYYAGVARGITGQTIETAETSLLNFTLREPYGVCGFILPWNFPLTLTLQKLAPALMAGNTAVIKPSEITPLSSIELARAIAEAGFPDGVINIVNGPGATVGTALVTHPLVARVSFTGGTDTGKAIFRAAADGLKRLTLELGGKSPLIVFDDADVDAAVKLALTDISRNTGQICVACTRLLVHERIAEEFVEKVQAGCARLRIGMPEDEATHMGPLISARQLERVQGYVNGARAEGAEPVAMQDLSSRDELRGGHFFAPTLILNATNDMQASQDEIFGPVQSIIRFRDEDEAVRIANDSRYGLAGVLYTRDAAQAIRVVKRLQIGNIAVNQGMKASVDAPFGGYKQSGLGRERGMDAILENMQIKNVKFGLR